MYVKLYHGAWVVQRVLPWYNYNTTKWLVVIYIMAVSYTMVVSSYIMVATGVNGR